MQRERGRAHLHRHADASHLVDKKNVVAAHDTQHPSGESHEHVLLTLIEWTSGIQVRAATLLHRSSCQQTIYSGFEVAKAGGRDVIQTDVRISPGRFLCSTGCRFL
jgi:hypothetical protein